MNADPNDNLNNQKEILNKLKSLESRISKLEAIVKGNHSNESEVNNDTSLYSEPELTEESESKHELGFESRVGEFGLGWLGSIVLLFGISFVTQYLQSIGYILFSSIFGYVSVAAIFLTAEKLKKNLPSLSNKLNIISFLLLYYVTLRLHFFTTAAICNKYVCILLLLAIIGSLFYFSIKKNSEFKSGIAYLMLIFLSYITDNTHLLFALVLTGAIITVFLFFKYGWWRQIIFSIIFTYISFIFYLVHNQFLMSESSVLTHDHGSIVYLLASVLVFSSLTFSKHNNLFPSAIIFISVVLNGLFFTIILSTYIFTFYINNYIGIFLLIFAFCFSISIILKQRAEWKHIPEFYALYSFVSLSIAVFGMYNFPFSYFLLSLQSLLVISMAIWYRSKTIIIMNFMLFVLLLFFYLFTSKSIDSVNISFALVPLISARIINWKKDRLDIKTELIRNAYLFVTFFCVLYALLRLVPDNFVTLSWSLTAVAYFVLSLILHNVKYRWMAISTMIATALYLFIVDLARVEVVYRIIAFMVLAIISIGISVYYAGHKKKKDNT